MSEVVPLADLNVTQINQLLKHFVIKVTGTKANKIAALAEELGADTISKVELRHILSSNDEIRELREMVSKLTATINEMSAQRAQESETIAISDIQQSTAQNGPEIAQHGTSVYEGQNAVDHRENNYAGATQARHIQRRSDYTVREIAEALPEFDPLHRSLTSVQFIQKVKQLQMAYDWPEEVTVFALTQKLKGVAREWLDAQPVFLTMMEFENNFSRDFPTTVNVAECHKQMMKNKRQTSTSYVKYYYEMLAIGRRGGIDEQSIVTYIIDGLNDTQLTKTLLAMNINTCSDLLSSLERYARKPTEQQYVMPKGENIEKDRKEPRCYNCNGMGHMAAKCPKPNKRQKCINCSMFGHEAKFCRKPAQGVSKVAAIQSQNKNPPILEAVVVNNKHMIGFVDTGSCRSLIGARSVIGMERLPTHMTLLGFGGAKVEVTEMVKAHIKIKQQVVTAQLLVVNDEMMPQENPSVEVLLGRDVLSQVDSINVLQVDERCGFEFNIEENLDDCSKNQVTELLMGKLDSFAENIKDIGKCKIGEFDIITTTDSPIVGKRYLVPFSQRAELTHIIENLLENNIIRPSESSHAASVLLVKKSNGENRMCVDFRALNAVTVKQHYLMPVVEEQIARMKGNKYFTVLDMTSGYYQIPVKENVRHLTAFLTHMGLYEFNVMPFGLVNAPMTFQRIMAEIIRKMHHRDKIVNYVDEVIIATETVEENLKVLAELLDALKDAGMTARPSKCYFMNQQVNFLGHKIDEKGIHPGEAKTECIRKFPIPSNATEVRRFLGTAGFFRKFIRNYSVIAKVLTELLKKDVKFIWTAEHQKSFDYLKEALSNDPVLAMYDANKSHEVHTDACAIGLSGILMQESEHGVKPVFYFSRQCTEAESHYSSHELEVLAIVETLQRFRMYLWGKPFTVVTDCNAVATTKQTTPLLPRIARWWLKLQEFDFICVHRSGAKMVHADAMSRAPVLQADREVETVAEKVLTLTGSLDWILALQNQDEKLKRIMELIRTDDTAEAKQLKLEYSIINDRLYRKIGDGCRLVVPSRERWRIVKSCHDDFGHFGVEKTIQRIAKDFWFARMRKYVKEFIDSCPECCVNKVKGGKQEGELHIREVAPIPFRSIHLDHLGPFPKSKQGNSYILVIICSFSKHSVIKAVRTTKSAPVVNILKDYFATYGQPIQIITDRGTAFTSKEFSNFLSDHGVYHVKVAVRTPRANGQAERLNRTVLASLRCMTKNQREWDKELPCLQWSINSQINSTTKMSPNDLIFNFNARDYTTNRFIQAMDEEILEQNKPAIDMKPLALENIKTAAADWKKRYDAKHRKPSNYHEGDIVAIEYIPAATGTSHKLDPKYKGPYVVTRVLNFDRYVVEDLPDVPLSQKHYVGILPSDRIKPWRCLGPSDEGDDYESPQSSDLSGEAELLTTPLCTKSD